MRLDWRRLPGGPRLDDYWEAHKGRFYAVRDKVLDYPPIVLVVRTIQELGADDATHMAASVAYYALFSLFPLLLGLIAVLGTFLDPELVKQELTAFIGTNLPGSQSLIEQNVDRILAIRGALGIFAVLGLLWSGSAVFGAINRAVNRAWDIQRDRPFYLSKAQHLLMALGVGALFLLSISASALISVTREAALLDFLTNVGLGFLREALVQGALIGSSLLFTLGIFLLVYKLLPNTKTFWSDIWPGALLAAVLFELAKNTFIIYLNQFANYGQVYGSLASVIALLLWSYLSAFILILGAEVSSEYGRIRRGLERGVLIARFYDDKGERRPQEFMD